MTNDSVTADKNPRPLRIVYMGTPDFAVPALKALINSRDLVVAVVTPPDRPRGRGRKLKPTAVKAAATKAGLPVYQPENVNAPESLEKIASWEPDVIVVAAYGQILRLNLLDLPPYGCINIHASLLPRYRGAAPINWAIANGEEETGVTIMQMDEGLDTGDMLLKKKTLIGPLETAGELHDRLAEMGAELIVDVMRLIHLDSLNPVAQDDEKSSYAPMLSRKDGAIDWNRSATEIANRIRGFNPWPGTFSLLRREDGEEQRFKFHLARPVAADELDVGEEMAPGTVLRASTTSGQLWIATGDGILDCLEIQAPGSRAMDARDFLNGQDISEGDRFQTVISD